MTTGARVAAVAWLSLSAVAWAGSTGVGCLQRVGGWREGGTWAVAASSNRIVTGEGRKLRVFDVDASGWVVGPVGELDLLDTIYDLELEGDRVWAAVSSSGIAVVDLTEPSAPQVVGSFVTAGEATQLELDGGRAYVLNRSTGVHILDASGAGDPTPLGFVVSPRTAWIDPHGSTLYLAGDLFGMRIVDVSDPALPGDLGSTSSSMGMTSVRVSGDRAYTIDVYATLEVFDVSDPGAIVSVGSVPTSGYWAEPVGSQSVYVFSPFLGTMEVYDVSGSTPVLSDSVTVNAAGVQRLAAAGNHLYAAAANQLRLLDITDIAHPIPSSIRRTFDQSTGVRIEGTTIAVGMSGATVADLEVTSPAAPVVTSTWFGTTETTGGRPVDFGTTRYVPGTYDGFHVLDRTNPLAPVLVRTVPTDGPTDSLAVSGQILVAANGTELECYALTDPTFPSSLGSVDVGGFYMQVRIEGAYAFVSTFFGRSVAIVDLTDPSHPQLVATIPTVGLTECLDVADGILAVGAWDTLRLFDVSDPQSWSSLGTVAGLTRILGVALYDHLALVTEDGDLTAIDVTDPEHPFRIESTAVPGYASDIDISGGLAAVAVPNAGVELYAVCSGSVIFNDGFESGNTGAWSNGS